jgi:ABC-type phosphate transport system substrate-binding protein
LKRLLFAALLLLAVTSSAMAAGFQVIVNADNPATSISSQNAQDFFLGKSKKWSDGTAAVPVDQLEKSAVRAEFSQAVLKKKVEAVKSYWLTIIFSGRGTPPVELKTDAAVLEAVRKDRGAIGYVAADAPLGAGVKAITVK